MKLIKVYEVQHYFIMDYYRKKFARHDLGRNDTRDDVGECWVLAYNLKAT